MSITIHDAEAQRMAQELSLLTGENVMVAVTKAIQERLRKEQERRAVPVGNLAQRIAPILARIDALPALDQQSAEGAAPSQPGATPQGESAHNSSARAESP